MPSEVPIMPRDTYARDLTQGANLGLPLQAGEVAYYGRAPLSPALTVTLSALGLLAVAASLLVIL